MSELKRLEAQINLLEAQLLQAEQERDAWYKMCLVECDRATDLYRILQQYLPMTSMPRVEAVE